MAENVDLTARAIVEARKAAPDGRFYAFSSSIDAKIGPLLRDLPDDLVGRPVEALLSEAAVLLERCTAAQRAKQDVEGKSLDFWLDQVLNERRLAIRAQQIAGGELKRSAAVAHAEANMHQTALEAAETQVNALQEALAVRVEGSAEFNHRVDLVASTTALGAYQQIPAVRASAASLATLTINQERSGARASVSAAVAGAVMHRGGKEIAELKEGYGNTDEPLEEAKYKAETEFYSSRRVLSQKQGSAYNFTERLHDIQTMFEVDIAAAYRRCQAAHRGMTSVFQIGRALPNVDAELPVAALVHWVRAAAEDLALIHDRQQRTRLNAILEDVIHGADADAYHAGRTIRFIYPEVLLSGFRFCRLRSLAIETVTDNPREIFGFILRLPDPAWTLGQDGTRFEAGQADIPPIYLSSIQFPGSNVDTKSNNDARILQNAFIGGSWTLQALHSNTGRAPDVIQKTIIYAEVDVLT